MTTVEAIILGAAQGLTEFLPVSSSGHLVLLQKIFGISESALLFDTLVHAGTLAAVFAVLRREIIALLRRPLQPLTGYLALATVPAVIAALLFKDAIEAAFASGAFLGFAFLLTGALLLAAEALSRRRAARGAMNGIDALVIGMLQAIAIIPGVSRSGATLSGALSRGLDRDFAARFSFLLSIPAILGALVLQMKDMAGGGVSIGDGTAIGAVPLVCGILTATVVGFFSIRLMLKIVRERSLAGFAVYVIALGGLTLLDRFVTHLVF
ncbi:MAG: undecaprenyl-diphosphate phosphatase [Treponematales bacterium]